jgi:membrane associated rhomboid family serine protease
VDRCPQCGYEPSNSILSVLVFWLVALPLGVIFGVLIVASIAFLATGGLTAGESFGGMFAGGLLGALPFWYIRRYRRRKRMTATE